MRCQKRNRANDLVIGPSVDWWRWRESNPRPKAFNAQFYMLSSPLNLGRRQYGVLNAPTTYPVLSSSRPTGGNRGRSHDNDPTPTSMSTRSVRARALSG